MRGPRGRGPWLAPVLIKPPCNTLPLKSWPAAGSPSRIFWPLLKPAAHWQCPPQQWESPAPPDYLQAIARFTECFERYCRNTGQAVPRTSASTWRLLANVLMAAKIYE